MLYNDDMKNLKQKFALYLSKNEASKFMAVYANAKSREGRTNFSEVIRELMGFPPKEGTKPVTIPEDRDFLYGHLEVIRDRKTSNSRINSQRRAASDS